MKKQSTQKISNVILDHEGQKVYRGSGLDKSSRKEHKNFRKNRKNKALRFS